MRHDFRRYYSVSYDEVELAEAVDLIATLPRGSLWRQKKSKYGEWSEERELVADVLDHIERFITLYATGTTEGAITITRPSTIAERERVRENMHRAKRYIETTEWEEVVDSGDDC